MNKADMDVQIASAISPDYENPDRVFDRKELKECIRCLPPTYSKPLKLFLAGYAYKEIAKMTEVPIGTVKSRIHIAKNKLKSTYLD
jgi:RNA polymerase sigma-70 factor (ECF subfamily)